MVWNSALWTVQKHPSALSIVKVSQQSLPLTLQQASEKHRAQCTVCFKARQYHTTCDWVTVIELRYLCFGAWLTYLCFSAWLTYCASVLDWHTCASVIQWHTCASVIDWHTCVEGRYRHKLSVGCEFISTTITWKPRDWWRWTDAWLVAMVMVLVCSSSRPRWRRRQWWRLYDTARQAQSHDDNDDVFMTLLDKHKVTTTMMTSLWHC